MRTLTDVLRDADPLRREPGRSAAERAADRARTLERAEVPDSGAAMPRRTFALAAAATLAIAIPAGIYLQHGVSLAAAVRFEVRLAEQSAAAGLREVMLHDGGRIYLHDELVLTNSDILRAEVTPGATPSSFNIALTFKPDGARKIGLATRDHIGRPLAILIDGAVVMAPIVRSPIGDSAVITGNYTQAEATRIVDGVIGR
jgi:preprotein translocase subunit SecD